MDSLFEGESRELVAGVDGQQTQTYKDTYVDGVKVASEMVGQPEVIQPIKRIVEVGIKKEETSQVLTETEVLAYTSIKEEDPNLPEGETKIKVQGVNGERKVRITRVTNNRTGQVSENREVISETAPVNEVLVVGTKLASTSLLDKKMLTLDEFMSLTEEQQDAFIAKKGTVPGTTIRTGATKDTLEKVESLINLDKLNAEFVNLLNAARAAEGLSAVTYAGQGSDAQNAATARANEMADHGSLRYQGTIAGAHMRPDGSKWTTIYTAEQVARQGWRGENALQLGSALSAYSAIDESRIANSLFTEWMNSASHKAVMMKDLDNLQVAVGIGLNDKAIDTTFRNGVTVAMLELVEPKP
ncbi:G5 domain-containing protein [Streptococcus suis]|uniref:G5 domain-containing protein n=1 Tax=Streptococcus suis TaxID=1307 RepID=UPI00201A3ECF|nr:G5 domain-containing protein [Streptococcus suis]